MLSTPSLKVQRIMSSVDMRGNELKNAVFAGGKLKNAIVSAQELYLEEAEGVVPGSRKGGVLMLNARYVSNVCLLVCICGVYVFIFFGV